MQTVEHLLAAAAALALDDMTGELDGPKPPIGDGSFIHFPPPLTEAGIAETPGQPAQSRVTAPFSLTDGEPTYFGRPQSPSGSLRPLDGPTP